MELNEAMRTTFAARDGMTRGVDVKLTGDAAVVEWSTKLGTIAILAIIVIAFGLMYFFGEPMLQAMGLIADAGAVSLTLKIFYAIPLIIFLIPLGIAWMAISRQVAPKDTELLARVVEQLKALGLNASIDGDEPGASA